MTKRDSRTDDLASRRAALRASDPVLRGLIDAKPDLDPDVWRQAIDIEGLFEALLYQVVGQQISVAALDAIYARLRGLFPRSRPTPDQLIKLSVGTLRDIGLSARKVEYVQDIARRALTGDFEGIADLPHLEARARLVAIRGIGPWTADGALYIAFGWTDVLISGDLVMRKAVQRAYAMPELPSVADVETIGERWRPHRSLAAAYLFDSMVGK